MMSWMKGTADMSYRATLACAIAVLLALGLAACSSGRTVTLPGQATPVTAPTSTTVPAPTSSAPAAQGGPTTTGSARARLTAANWLSVTGRDLDCQAIGLGWELLNVQHDDVTGDRLPDALVTTACRVATSSAPEQLEVFDGASNPQRPTRIGVLVREREHPAPADDRGVRIRSIAVDHGVVRVTAAAFSTAAANCCPDLLFRRSFRWTKRGFTADPWRRA
jgi:hypothetical protein